jgi:RNA polymerase sigma-70 factor (ECF subfamily)
LLLISVKPDGDPTLTMTSVSLLDRLKAAPPEASDWGRLQEIYLPLIARWLGRIPGMNAEIDDLAQDVFVVMVREIPRFDRQREGSFRAWLRQVTVNKVRTRRKQLHRRPVAGIDQTDGFLDQLAQPNSELAREWDLDHDRHVFQKLMAIVQPDFQPATWEAFRLFAIEGRKAADVATELGIKVDSVIQAKSRILKRLREEAGELLG